MRSTGWVLTGVAAALVFGVLAASNAQAPQEKPPAPPVAAKPQDPAPSASDDLARLRNASDPSSAIEAYGRAIAAAPKDLAVKAAFVRRMVDFGLPEMVDSQALDVASHDESNGIAWAVLAYMNAKRGRTADALADIVLAAGREVSDPFVLRTAGQLVAWLDTRADKTTIPDELTASVETMRKSVGARPGFAEAYRRAKEAYTADAGAASDEAAPPAAPRSSQPLVQPVEPENAPQAPPPGDGGRSGERAAVPVDDPPREIVTRTEVVHDTQYVPVYDTTYVYTDPYWYESRPHTVVYDSWCPTVWYDPWCSSGWRDPWCGGWGSGWCSTGWGGWSSPCSGVYVGGWGVGISIGFGGSCGWNDCDWDNDCHGDWNGHDGKSSHDGKSGHARNGNGNARHGGVDGAVARDGGGGRAGGARAGAGHQQQGARAGAGRAQGAAARPQGTAAGRRADAAAARSERVATGTTRQGVDGATRRAQPARDGRAAARNAAARGGGDVASATRAGRGQGARGGQAGRSGQSGRFSSGLDARTLNAAARGPSQSSARSRAPSASRPSASRSAGSRSSASRPSSSRSSGARMSSGASRGGGARSSGGGGSRGSSGGRSGGGGGGGRGGRAH